MRRNMAIAIAAGLTLNAAPVIAPNVIPALSSTASAAELDPANVNITLNEDSTNTTVKSGENFNWDDTVETVLKFTLPQNAQPGDTWTISTSRGFQFIGVNNTSVDINGTTLLTTKTALSADRTFGTMTLTLSDSVGQFEPGTTGEIKFIVKTVSNYVLANDSDNVYPLNFTIAGTPAMEVKPATPIQLPALKSVV